MSTVLHRAMDWFSIQRTAYQIKCITMYTFITEIYVQANYFGSSRHSYVEQY